VSIITTALKAWRTKRRERALTAAHKVITDAGLFVCCIKTVAGTNYLVDGSGKHYNRAGRVNYLSVCGGYQFVVNEVTP
jgi:hypothetical protein